MLARELDQSTTNPSHHLQVLRRAQLVTAEQSPDAARRPREPGFDTRQVRVSVHDLDATS